VSFIQNKTPTSQRHDYFAGKRDGCALDRHKHHDAKPPHEIIDIARKREDEGFEGVYEIG
jgi:hypothetical protein